MFFEDFKISIQNKAHVRQKMATDKAIIHCGYKDHHSGYNQMALENKVLNHQFH